MSESKTKHLDQRWPLALWSRLKAWADARGIGISAAIFVIVADRLDNDEREAKR